MPETYRLGHVASSLVVAPFEQFLTNFGAVENKLALIEGAEENLNIGLPSDARIIPYHLLWLFREGQGRVGSFYIIPIYDAASSEDYDPFWVQIHVNGSMERFQILEGAINEIRSTWETACYLDRSGISDVEYLEFLNIERERTRRQLREGLKERMTKKV